MRVLHVVGRQGSGKTTLLCELLEELTRRGLHVGTVKHTSHDQELDRPGKDSHRHRLAGASPAAVVSAHQIAAFIDFGEGDDPLARLAPLFAGCDLVLLEGFASREGVKLEVWRESVGKAPLANERSGIVAVVSDDAPAVTQPVWPRSDARRLADEVLRLVGLR